MAGPPSLILVNMDFWYDSCILCQILNLPTKFCEDWSNSKEMATDFRNSRWRWQPSSKIHFRLNRQYEKGTPGLLLPIKHLTFVGLSRRLRVVYSWELQCWSDFRCKSAKAKNGSKCWCFWTWGPFKVNLKAPNPEKARVRNRTRRLSY